MSNWLRQWLLDPRQNKNAINNSLRWVREIYIELCLQLSQILFEYLFDVCLCRLYTWDFHAIHSMCSNINHFLELWALEGLYWLWVKMLTLTSYDITTQRISLTWSVATSHSIAAWLNTLSLYGITQSFTFFSLRSWSRVWVAYSAAALRFLISPGSLDS